ncbi:vanZ like family protein [bacterium BMS3Abin15]|nr:vanZ like family protein [bacterium BMS3Abin15]
MINKSPIKILAFYYAPLLFWMGLIFYFSSLPGFGRQYSPDIYFYITRKGAHLIEFFILTILLIRAVRFYKIKKVYLVSALFSLAYAFSDEIHQIFVIGREGKLSDIGIDLIGIILAVVLYKLFSKKQISNNPPL